MLRRLPSRGHWSLVCFLIFPASLFLIFMMPVTREIKTPEIVIVPVSECTLRRQGVLMREPLVTIFVHEPLEDKVVSASLLEANGNGSHFEASYTKIFADHLAESKGRGFFVDVGANIGIHALALAAKGFAVEAFEPDPVSALLLQCSMDQNKETLGGQLALHRVALGESDAELCMVHSPDNWAHAYMVPCDGKVDVKVPVRTLDSYWRDSWHQRHIDVLKLDVEGYEAVVLRGAKELLKTSPPGLIQAEFNNNNLKNVGVRPYELFEILHPLGYKIVDKGVDITHSWKTWADKAIHSQSMNDLLFIHP